MTAVLVRTMSDLNLPFPEAGRLLQWAQQRGVGFANVSAKTGRNVAALFALAARMFWGARKEA